MTCREETGQARPAGEAVARAGWAAGGELAGSDGAVRVAAVFA